MGEKWCRGRSRGRGRGKQGGAEEGENQLPFLTTRILDFVHTAEKN